jgi:hypothetical protein
MTHAWTWLTQTDAGLATRVGAGATVFAVLALLDYRRHGPAATRWREYTFLLAAVAAALLYGILNDQLTSRISWEYFYYGKGLDEILGPQLPPGPRRLHFEAAKVGMKATWTAGLLLGVFLLLANNPSKRYPRATYRRLLAMIALILAVTVLTATIVGAAGYLGLLTRFSRDFTEMVAHDEFRPHRFMLVYGIHLGGYIGGLLGCALAITLILRHRRTHVRPEDRLEHRGAEARRNTTQRTQT